MALVRLTMLSVIQTVKFVIIYQWSRGLSFGSAAAHLLGLRFRIPPGPWISISCECYVLSGRGFCHGSVTRPEEFYRVLCVCVCVCICVCVCVYVIECDQMQYYSSETLMSSYKRSDQEIRNFNNCIIMNPEFALSKSFIYQLMHSRFALKGY